MNEQNFLYKQGIFWKISLFNFRKNKIDKQQEP